MKIVVCVRQGLDGELSPFDACAYEQALRVVGGEVTLLSMGPASVADFLLRLTRLGAKRAVLLQDKGFAGADTLATAYALSLAIRKIQPDLVLCGRQTLVGDTGQTPPMLAQLCGYSLITNAMQVEAADTLTCVTREEGIQTASYPAVCTVERTCSLRLPGLRSRPTEVETWDAAAIEADLSRCGLTGSPTRVLETHENEAGRRRCRYIEKAELSAVIEASLAKRRQTTEAETVIAPLATVWAVGEAVLPHAQRVGKHAELIECLSAEEIAERIEAERPDAVLWGCDPWSKRTAALVAARLGLGLCADCTGLDTDGETLYMIRPALSGSVIAKIKSLTRPAMATVRTEDAKQADILVAAGFGAAKEVDKVVAFTDKIGGELVATRRMVDEGVLPYDRQVGLTGRTVAPPVYIAVGVSGAVHHIVGMQRAGTVIAINPDPKAPIFDYADYGIVANVEEVF
ncbi:MAG: FAD-binding protein [Clostridia bacterium]|nr:FAD-binding protein [Clostridia bacterium]